MKALTSCRSSFGRCFSKLNENSEFTATDVDAAANAAPDAAADTEVEVHILNLTGLLCTIDAKRSWSARALKASIAEATGVPQSEQRLLLGTSSLQDSYRLSDILPGETHVAELTLLRVAKSRARTGTHSLLNCAPPEDFRDATKVLAAVCHCGYDLNMCPMFQSDRKIVLAAVEANGMALQYAAKSLQADKEIVLAAVTRDAFALKYADKSMKADREVVLAALTGSGGHRDALRLSAEELKSDRDVALAAVSTHGYALEYVSADLQADRQIVLAAVRQAGTSVLKYADASLAMAIRQEYASGALH